MDPVISRLLLVEDEDSTVFAFKKVLSGPAISVDTAQSLSDAIILLNKNKYDVVIADLRLSGAAVIEGFEVIKVARVTQADCIIVIVTAFGRSDTREVVFDLGADFYFEKPVSPQKIKEMLQSKSAVAPFM